MKVLGCTAVRDFCCPGAVGDPWVVFPWGSGQQRHSCQQPGAGSSELNPSLVSVSISVACNPGGPRAAWSICVGSRDAVWDVGAEGRMAQGRVSWGSVGGVKVSCMAGS